MIPREEAKPPSLLFKLRVLPFAAALAAILASTRTANAASWVGTVDNVSPRTVVVYSETQKHRESFPIGPNFDEIYDYRSHRRIPLAELKPGNYVRVQYDGVGVMAVKSTRRIEVLRAK